MKSQILLFIGLFVVCLCCNAQTEECISDQNTASAFELKGKVKSVVEKTYLYVKDKNGKLKQVPQYRQTIDFNKSQQVKQIYYFDLLHSYWHSTNYKYNKEGQILSKHQFIEDHHLINGYDFEYDDKARIIVEVRQDNHKSFYANPYERFVYSYSQQGDSLLVLRMDQHNKLRSKSLFINKIIKEIEELSDAPEDSLVARCIYKYNEKGRLKDAHFFTQKGILTSEHIKLYDDAGFLKIIKSSNMHNNEIRQKEYEYDECGNPSKIKEYDAKNQLLKAWDFRRLYDKYGNWKTETESLNGVVRSETIRDITYY
jgi:hypothetical protein